MKSWEGRKSSQEGEEGNGREGGGRGGGMMVFSAQVLGYGVDGV